MATVRDGRAPDDPGWPRLKCPYKPQVSQRERYGWGERVQLPVPWINGVGPERCGDWLEFPAKRSFAAYYDYLCVVCGEAVEGIIVFGSATNGLRETAGPGGHPRCLWLAANTCPNLLDPEKEIVAWAYTGEGRGHVSVTAEHGEPYEDSVQMIDEGAVALTRAELKALARADPLGLTGSLPGS